ncbi:MAG: hypothetical protein OZSIB_3398 [Candidatus Ozemobacter sibiricus]|jgi:hypothetical protein|uniref:Uncharacterized protein n=1 Tax=Candidatus Ozemobacter sibiricus TaxID=2268124 RepID=A0A367ZQ89_9BACT|nr:MAG: hypothetical protein OZSIB_3398 [Candidatus Ozemobacter sibiricus]
MEIGNETWKWGLVLILLAIFIMVANQAYIAVTSQEDYPPPDDYKQGDSYDLEHQSGPGAGQPIDVPPELLGSGPLPVPGSPPQELPPLDQPDIDLNQIGNPGKAD